MLQGAAGQAFQPTLTHDTVTVAAVPANITAVAEMTGKGYEAGHRQASINEATRDSQG